MAWALETAQACPSLPFHTRAARKDFETLGLGVMGTVPAAAKWARAAKVIAAKARYYYMPDAVQLATSE